MKIKKRAGRVADRLSSFPLWSVFILMTNLLVWSTTCFSKTFVLASIEFESRHAPIESEPLH